MELPAFQSKAQSSLCPSRSGVVVKDGDDVPSSVEVRILKADHSRRWRGPALRRAADSARRISPLSFDGDKRGRVRQLHEAVVFDKKFLWSIVSLKSMSSTLPDMTCRLEQGLRNKIGSVILEEASFLLSIGAKTSALEVSKRVQALK